MKHVPQFVDHDGAVQQQAHVAAEALRRSRVRNNPAESPESPDRDRDVRIAAGLDSGRSTADSTLNWASGQQVATVGRSDIPFSSDLSRVAGVGAESVTTERSPTHATTAIHPAPDCKGGASGMDAICGGQR
jgi:hypothetical protein